MEGFIDVSQVLRSGIYMLCHRGVVIYIGQSKSMLARVYSHKSLWGQKQRRKVPEWMPIKGILFDEVHICPCPLDKLDELELAMINLYKPKFNIRLKTPGPATQPFNIRINGLTIPVNTKPTIIERRV